MIFLSMQSCRIGGNAKRSRFASRAWSIEDGLSKIQGRCQQAARDGLQYAWVDSCCIDKTSSAELSEAINSMFEWYRKAAACYTFLADVPGELSVSEHYQKRSASRESQWWTRGWTLQELLAPGIVLFYDREWGEVGTKDYLKELISSLTEINDLEKFMDASVAQTMSWASKLKTTRLRDEAYCLMGLFNVNMPPLYGEGLKAFQRLQLGILRTSDEESIFAYNVADYKKPQGKDLGLLAPTPDFFKNCGDIVLVHFILSL